jgi:hypothetical protein
MLRAAAKALGLLEEAGVEAKGGIDRASVSVKLLRHHVRATVSSRSLYDSP